MSGAGVLRAARDPFTAEGCEVPVARGAHLADTWIRVLLEPSG